MAVENGITGNDVVAHLRLYVRLCDWKMADKWLYKGYGGKRERNYGQHQHTLSDNMAAPCTTNYKLIKTKNSLKQKITFLDKKILKLKF